MYDVAKNRLRDELDTLILQHVKPIHNSAAGVDDVCALVRTVLDDQVGNTTNSVALLVAALTVVTRLERDGWMNDIISFDKGPVREMSHRKLLYETE